MDTPVLLMSASIVAAGILVGAKTRKRKFPLNLVLVGLVAFALGTFLP